MTRYLALFCLAASLSCFPGCGGSTDAIVPEITGEMSAEQVAEMETESELSSTERMEQAYKTGKNPYAK